MIDPKNMAMVSDAPQKWLILNIGKASSVVYTTKNEVDHTVTIT